MTGEKQWTLNGGGRIEQLCHAALQRVGSERPVFSNWGIQLTPLGSGWMLKPLDLLAGRSSEATLRAHVSFLPHHRAGALLPENTGDSSPHFLVVFQLRAPPYSLESIEYPDSPIGLNR
jgi:hypothetical protein